MIIREGELEFDFSNAKKAEKFDKQERGVSSGPRPHGMDSVDFVVEEETRILLIEVKDPSCKGAPEKERKKFIEEMKHKTLIHNKLVPKARDTYTFLHLMKRDKKPFLYVVLLGLEEFSLDFPVLMNFKDHLLQRLRQESDIPWKLNYVTDCIVVKVSDWGKFFPKYGLKRVP